MTMNESTWLKLIPITRIELIAGLACCADEDLHRLSQWAAEGWHVVEVRRMYVVLERTHPAQVVFAVDYQHHPDAEYFGLCRMAGWTHVVSLSQSIHLFSMVWLVSTLEWLAMHDDGFLAWMFIGSAFVSIYVAMTMFWYTALPWVVYQMRRYGAEIRWSRHRARLFVDGVSVVTGAVCGWMVAY